MVCCLVSDTGILGKKKPSDFFPEYACVTSLNNKSFSFIHQKYNIPSHLFYDNIRHQVNKEDANHCNTQFGESYFCLQVDNNSETFFLARLKGHYQEDFILLYAVGRGGRGVNYVSLCTAARSP